MSKHARGPVMDRNVQRREILARANAVAGSSARARAAKAEAPSGDSPTTAELWLYGVVGGFWMGFNAETVASALRGLDVDEIQVRLHSPGGNAIDGIAIANLLRNHKARITVVVDGLAASAASVIALAGDEVVMSPGSQMMIHDPWMFTVGNAGDLRSDAGFLDKQAENYAGIYAGRAGGTAAEWRDVMLADGGRGTWYTAQETVDAGLADRVGTVTSSTPPPPDPATEMDPEDEDAAARAAWDLEVLVHPDARAAWRGSSPNPPAASADGSSNTTTEGGSAVAFNSEQMTELRRKLGVAEDADEATILAAVDESLAERAEPTAAAPVPEGMALIDESTLDQLRSDAAAGREARNEQQAAARRTAVDAAVQDGRIPPSRREHWMSLLAADPDAAETLAKLAKGTVPLEELGHAGGVEDAFDEEDSAYAQIFPKEA